MQQSVLEASHGLAGDENLDVSDLITEFGRCVHTAEPKELPPFLPGEITLAAAHIVEVQNLAGMPEVLDVVLRLQILSEVLRVDQAAAEFMEEESHGIESDKARDGVAVPRFG